VRIKVPLARLLFNMRTSEDKSKNISLEKSMQEVILLDEKVRIIFLQYIDRKVKT